MKIKLILTALVLSMAVFAVAAKADNTNCPTGTLAIEDTASSDYHNGYPDTAFTEFNTAVQDRLDCDKLLSGYDLYTNQLWLALDYLGASHSARDASTASYHAQTEQDFGYTRTIVGWLDKEPLDASQMQILGEVKGMLIADREDS